VVPVVIVAPPGLAVTRYPVIADPPFDNGAHETFIDPYKSPGIAKTDIGAEGIVDGTTTLLTADGSLLPPLVFAVTVKVYDVPFVNPDTIARYVVALIVVAVNPPGLDVTV
jgi:hypothetical protein